MFIDFLIRFFIYYFIVINIFAFVVMGYDKLKAKFKRYRITERFLINTAMIGGGFGTLIAMLLFRHKIRTKKFFIGVPVIITAHLVLVYFIARFLDQLLK